MVKPYIVLTILFTMAVFLGCAKHKLVPYCEASDGVIHVFTDDLSVPLEGRDIEVVCGDKR